MRIFIPRGGTNRVMTVWTSPPASKRFYGGGMAATAIRSQGYSEEPDRSGNLLYPLQYLGGSLLAQGIRPY